MINIFDMMGPVMVGPSSSHTAGAARIGNMGRTLLGEEVARADIGLHGSFAETGFGHGTDRALLAGLLGMKPDDLRIPNAYEEANRAGMAYSFRTVELRDAHPNTALLELTGKSGKQLTLQASSIGSAAEPVSGHRRQQDRRHRRKLYGRLQHADRPQSGRVRLGRGDHVDFKSGAHQCGKHERQPSPPRRRRADGH
mgnify:CR=1 FL=1